MTRPVYGGPDGHGRYGILDRRDEDGRVLCHECGRWWHHLATHVTAAHGIPAADYRRTHGLSSGTALIGTRVRTKLAAASSQPERVAQLASVRDPDHARTAMTRDAQWAPELVAGRIARGRARRVDLTPEQIAELGDWTDISGWTVRARALMERDGVPAAAIARAVDVPAATVWQRLRRHPPTPYV